MKKTLLAIACLLSVGGLGCVADVEDPEDQDQDQDQDQESAEVREADQELEYCAAQCGWVWRYCAMNGIPYAQCQGMYNACINCELWP